MCSCVCKKALLIYTLISVLRLDSALIDGKYGNDQVFDVQRTINAANKTCQVSNFIIPYISPYEERRSMSWDGVKYIKFAKVNDNTGVQRTMTFSQDSKNYTLPLYSLHTYTENDVEVKQKDKNGVEKVGLSNYGYVMVLGNDGLIYIGQPGDSGGENDTGEPTTSIGSFDTGTGYFFYNKGGVNGLKNITFDIDNLYPGDDIIEAYSANPNPNGALNADPVALVNQYDYLQCENRMLNLQLDNNLLDRIRCVAPKSSSPHLNENMRKLSGKTYNHVCVMTSYQVSNTNSDGYKFNVKRLGVEYYKYIQPNFVLGAQINLLSSDLSGDNSGGGLNKQHLGLYGLLIKKDWVLKSDLGFAINQYDNFHSSYNSSSAHGHDIWFNNKLYTPSYSGFRLYANVRVERNFRNSTSDGGAEATRVSYDEFSDTDFTCGGGLRYDVMVLDNVHFAADAGIASDKINMIKIVANVKTDKGVLFGVNLIRQCNRCIKDNIIEGFFKWTF